MGIAECASLLPAALSVCRRRRVEKVGRYVSRCASSSQFSATFSLFFPLNPTLFDKLAEFCGLFA
jgi:hypothetical protein